MPSQSPHFELEELGDGVWAALHRTGGDATGNAGIVDLGDATLVFDAFLTPRAGRDLAAAARELTGRDAAYVVNSHYHNDHVRGSTAFPEATLIATAATRDLLDTLGRQELDYDAKNAKAQADRLHSVLEDGAEADRERAEFFLPYWEAILDSLPEATVRLPELTFERRLEFHGSKRTAVLQQVGPAHTPDDSVLLLPHDRVAFASDLLFVRCHPFLPDGDPEAWIDVLEASGAWRADRIVPGHGPVGTMDDVDRQIAYMRHLQDEALHRVAAGDSVVPGDPPEAPEPFDSWLLERPFYAVNLRFLMEREQSGPHPE